MSPLQHCASLISLFIILVSGALAALEALRQEDTLPAAAFAVDDACHAGNENSETGSCDLSLRQLRSVLAVDSQQLDEPTKNVTLKGALGATLPLGHPSASQVYPKHPGFTLFLVEEFDQALDLEKDPIWTWSDGGLKEGQVRFVKEQIKFQDGKMKIEVRANHGHQQTCSNAQSEDVPHKPLVAGEIRTRFNMFRYGRYEVRMKAPSVQPHNPNVDGNFVSTMFVFRDASFKHWHEIDVEVTGRAPGAISTNILTADYQAKWKPSMQETDYPISYQHMNVRAEFHDYAFEWLPGKIRWYVDGKMVREKRNDRLAVPDKSAKIMMNLWIYHDAKPFVPFGGKHLDKDRFPMHAEYDWFRFYKWDGDHHYPPADMSSKSLTGDDMYLTSNNPCDGIPQIGEVLKYGKKLKPCKATCR
ncbi:unnamed protein product [Polarella glacialis]|uniref:GH16 domain-containing protein n=1 Tax=Polarella glacialis TaxID=89957 RepID=A0A813LYA8_POLGL|nr:unnamed protein product [Polarella glacialis]